MQRIWTLVGKDFRIFFKDPVAMGLAFAVPLVMILVFGLVFGGQGGGVTISELAVLTVNQDRGPAGARLIHALDSEDEIMIIDSLRKGEEKIALDSVTARARVKSGRNTVALILPEDFSEGIKAGVVRASILEDPRDPVTAGIVVGMMQKEVFSTFPMLMPMSLIKQFDPMDQNQMMFNEEIRKSVEEHFGYKIPDSAFQGRGGLFPEEMILGSDAADGDTGSVLDFDRALARILDIERESVAGEDVANPGIAQSVAGPAVLFMLFGVGAIAASLLREMHTGTVQRILMSGTRASEVLFSKFLYAVILGSIQLTAMMFYGNLIFDLQIFDHPLALAVVIVSTAIVMSGLGLLITALARTEEQAGGIQVVVILSISAIGGAMFPSFLMPKVVKAVAVLTPVHWAMQGFTDIFWRNQGVPGILFECAVLMLMAAITVGISIIIFRKRLAVELG